MKFNLQKLSKDLESTSKRLNLLYIYADTKTVLIWHEVATKILENRMAVKVAITGLKNRKISTDNL